MSAGMVALQNGKYATTLEAVTALELEARRQGISYGRLVANTDGYEQEQIVRAYCMRKRRAGNRRKEG